ncbi:MAG: Lrp/AsnC family transcriptional regulator [Pseudomonadota bacterium]
MSKLDKKDLAILAALQQDGRASWTTLAERVQLSATACQRRVRLLEDSGVIRGYRATVAYDAMGYGVEAFITVRVERQSPDVAKQFRDAVARLDEVLSCHLLSGDTDFLLRVVAADLARFGRFIQRDLLTLPGIKDASSLIVLETIKAASTLTQRAAAN